ncbi:MAG: hypothetical protein N2170_01315 [Bacteroidia bacterium]|nr:hypothetical protein [Bacteroidia bacterium]
MGSISFVLSTAVAGFLLAQTASRSHFRLNGYLRSELYAGQFPASSYFPSIASGDMRGTGWGFGGDYIFQTTEHLRLEGGFALERWKVPYARAGESLEGFTYLGGWTSPPVPYETYYQGSLVKLRVGLAGNFGEKVETAMGGGLNIGSYSAFWGSSTGTTRYSEPASGIGLGYYLRLDVGFPISSNGIRIFTPSFFLALDYVSARPTEFKDFLWVGVNHRIEQQLFGIGGYRVGIAFLL